MADLPQCRNTRYPHTIDHPSYAISNNGYCLTCCNVGIDEADAELDATRAERDKLQAFKDWCHSYLDGKGVPHHPPGTHGAEGCRMGDRIDWVLAERDALAKALNAIVMRLLHTTDAGAADAAQIAYDALAAVRANRDAGPGSRAFAPTTIDGENEEFVAEKVADGSG